MVDVAGFDADRVGEAAVGLEEVGVALVAAEAEAGGDVERHLVAAVGDAAGRGTSRRRRTSSVRRYSQRP